MVRRKPRTFKENIASSHRAARSSPQRSRRSHKATSKSQPLHAISLDEVAELSERPSQSCIAVLEATFSPKTPDIRRRPRTSLGPVEPWKYMPSSPPVQSSPPRENERLPVFPLQAFCSLEWACLHARKTDDCEDLSSPDASGRSADSKVATLLTEDHLAVGLNLHARSEDLEAAIILLEIKARS